MKIEAPSRLLLSLQKDAPSRFTLKDVRSPSFNKTTSALVYRQQPLSNPQAIPTINYRAPNLPERAIRVWGNRGFQVDNTGSVPNVAYEPALQGNIFDAYCTALYNTRSGN